MSSTDKKEPCLLPWIELHINTLGQLKTCCAQFDFLEENKGASFRDVFNGKNFKAIRNQFLAGQTPKVCEACVQAEANGMSYKTAKSKQWSSFTPDILAPQNQDKNFPVRSLDVRFGNLCNFSCRTCDSDNSSRWQKIDTVVGRKTTVVERVAKGVLLNQINSVLDEVTELYFAGGEPLLSEEHYLVLEEIIRRKRTNIKITYNTNLSLLSAHGRDVVDLWKKLDQVIIYPSIDSIGLRGEYIRSGFKWEQFEENFNMIKNYVGCLHSVLSVYNVFSITDLFLWAHSKNTMLSIFPAYHPVEISASILPLEVRLQAADKILKLLSENKFTYWQLAQLNTAAEFLKNNHTPEHLEKFINFNRALDQLQKTDFIEVFPEHLAWFEKIRT